MAKKEEDLVIPSMDYLRLELAREEVRYQFRKTLLHMAGVLAVVAAITTLVATRVLNLLQVNGSSMSPTLENGEMVVLLQTKRVETGDVIGFHYGGEVLIKRVIGCGGDLIEIDQEGNVSVNGETLAEPYLAEKSLGRCELDFPCRVPEGMYFVLGDNRAVSIDSRIRTLGCVEDNQIIGRVLVRGWPWSRAGIVH